MKDRLLFWVDAALEHFGIAKFLQEKYDCDMFAIIDTNEGKKFFQTQQLVKFRKVWYYRDHLSKTNKKPDLEYLRSFEEKYKINLWKIAYSDTIFYRYNPYHKFSSDEILQVYEQECKFFENVLDEIKPDYLIMKTTDSSKSQLLQQICKARGIRVLTLGFARFGYRANISAEYDTLDNLGEGSEKYSTHEIKTIDELQKHIEGCPTQESAFRKKFRASNFEWLKAALQYLLLLSDTSYKNYYAHAGRTIIRVIVTESFLSLRRWYREFFINRNLIRQIDKREPFVYFPLQLEPERTLLVPAPFYSNQLEVIINIAKSLPVGYNLYVKEHPMQRIRDWRNISYYKQILDLPNVKLIHPSVSSDEMIQNCSLAITITGTAGVEAPFYGKPSIVIGDVIYSSLPSVYKLKNIEELPQAIRTSLQKKVNLSDLNEFVNLIDENSFEFDVGGLFVRTCECFYYGGFLFDIDIPFSKMNSFLEENRSLFEQLALEHIKKIRQYKEHESLKKQKTPKMDLQIEGNETIGLNSS